MSVLAFAQARLREIDAEVATLTDRLANGAVEDWSAYRKAVGQRHGLLMARATITEAFSDDEQDQYQLRSIYAGNG